jgi:hypothetical protein
MKSVKVVSVSVEIETNTSGIQGRSVTAWVNVLREYQIQHEHSF